MALAALYTADPWDSALVEIRVRRPAAHAGVEIIQGCHAGKVNHSLVDKVDLVIIQRDFPRFPDAPRLIQHAQSLGKPVVYEIDDWLFDVPNWNSQYAAYKNYLNGMLWTVIQADRVITSNHLIAEKLALFNPDVRIFENYLVDELWPVRPPLQSVDGPIKIGFMGSSTHQQDVHWLSPVLETVLEKYAGKVNLFFWGCQPSEKLRERPDVLWQDIHIQSYSEFANYFSQQTCDIFIAPLTTNEFNRAKSPLKYLEYSALGVPGVYSKIDPFEYVIKDGENGLLASTLPEWQEKLETLILSPELRENLARTAQMRLTRDWQLSDHYQHWLEALTGPKHAPGDLSTPTQASLSHITEKTQQQIWELEGKIGELGGNIGELSQEVTDLRGREIGLRDQLDAVLSSNTWKLAQKFQKLINLIRPRK